MFFMPWDQFLEGVREVRVSPLSMLCTFQGYLGLVYEGGNEFCALVLVLKRRLGER